MKITPEDFQEFAERFDHADCYGGKTWLTAEEGISLLGHIEAQSARISELESVSPSALKEKLRSAESRISELESEVLRLNSGSKQNGRTMPPHEFAQMVNELRDVPDVQSKRELIVKVLTSFNIRPKKAAEGSVEDE